MKIQSYFIHFPLMWIKFCTGDVHNNSVSRYEFCKNCYSKILTLRKVGNGFLSILSTFIVQFGPNSLIRALHIMLLIIGELEENRPPVGRTFTRVP
jgi:hypothetical protein